MLNPNLAGFTFSPGLGEIEILEMTFNVAATVRNFIIFTSN